MELDVFTFRLINKVDNEVTFDIKLVRDGMGPQTTVAWAAAVSFAGRYSMYTMKKLELLATVTIEIQT